MATKTALSENKAFTFGNLIRDSVKPVAVLTLAASMLVFDACGHKPAPAPGAAQTQSSSLRAAPQAQHTIVPARQVLRGSTNATKPSTAAGMNAQLKDQEIKVLQAEVAALQQVTTYQNSQAQPSAVQQASSSQTSGNQNAASQGDASSNYNSQPDDQSQMQYSQDQTQYQQQGNGYGFAIPAPGYYQQAFIQPYGYINPCPWYGVASIMVGFPGASCYAWYPGGYFGIGIRGEYGWGFGFFGRGLGFGGGYYADYGLYGDRGYGNYNEFGGRGGSGGNSGSYGRGDNENGSRGGVNNGRQRPILSSPVSRGSTIVTSGRGSRGNAGTASSGSRSLGEGWHSFGESRGNDASRSTASAGRSSTDNRPGWNNFTRNGAQQRSNGSMGQGFSRQPQQMNRPQNFSRQQFRPNFQQQMRPQAMPQMRAPQTRAPQMQSRGSMGGGHYSAPARSAPAGHASGGSRGGRHE